MASKTTLDSHCRFSRFRRPILCSPFKKPDKHWLYDPRQASQRRTPDGAMPAIGTRQSTGWCSAEKLFMEEQRDDLPLVNALRKDVDRWREADYRGASNVTRNC